MEQRRLQWLEHLNRIEQVAGGSIWHRFGYRPWTYFLGMVHLRGSYALTKRGWHRRADTFFGASLEVKLPAGLDIYLLRAKTHPSELRLARLMIRQLQVGQTVLDIGAHYGFFASLAGALVGNSGRVVAVEAAPDTFPLLQRNLAPLTQAEAHQLAAARDVGHLNFYQFPTLYSEYNTTDETQYQQAVRETGQPGQQTTVPAQPMDELIAQTGASPDFIKLDVEGAEEAVLAGLTHWLSQKRGLLVMEYLAPDRQNEGHRRAAGLLKQYGWQAHRIAADGTLSPCPDIEAMLAKEELDSDNVAFVAV